MFKMYKTWHLQVYIYFNRNKGKKGEEAIHVKTWLLHPLPLSYFNPGNFSDPINHTAPWTASLAQLRSGREGGREKEIMGLGGSASSRQGNLQPKLLQGYNKWLEWFLFVFIISLQESSVGMESKSWTKLTRIQAAPSALPLVKCGNSHSQRKEGFECTSCCQPRIKFPKRDEKPKLHIP